MRAADIVIHGLLMLVIASACMIAVICGAQWGDNTDPESEVG